MDKKFYLDLAAMYTKDVAFWEEKVTVWTERAIEWKVRGYKTDMRRCYARARWSANEKIRVTSEVNRLLAKARTYDVPDFDVRELIYSSAVR